MDIPKRLKLVNICKLYNNITKKEFDRINFSEYSTRDFMYVSNYCLYSAFEICCLNNNFLIIKYFCVFSKYKFVKFFQLLVQIPDAHQHLYNCNNNNNLKIIKFIITQFNIPKKYVIYDFYIKKNSLSFLKFIIKKFKMVKSDFFKINQYGKNCLYKYYIFDDIDCLIYIIKKFNITKQEILYDNNIIYLFFTSRSLTIKNMKYFIKIWDINKSDLLNNKIDLYNYYYVDYNYDIIKYIIITYRLNCVNIYSIGLNNKKPFFRNKKLNKLISCSINIITNKYINYNKIFETIYL